MFNNSRGFSAAEREHPSCAPLLGARGRRTGAATDLARL